MFLAALLVMPALPVRAEKEDSQAVIFADSIVTDVKADGDNTADIIQSDSEAGSNIIESSTEGTEAGGNVTENPTEGTEAGSDVTGSPTEGTETGSDVTEIPTEGTEAGSDVAENPTEGTEAGSDATENPVEGPEADKENEGAELISGSVPEYGTEGVIFSTGGEYQLVINPSLSEEEAYAGFTDTFGEDGSYTIDLDLYELDDQSLVNQLVLTKGWSDQVACHKVGVAVVIFEPNGDEGYITSYHPIYLEQ